MKQRAATIADLPAITELLDATGLPSSDCGDHVEHFIVVEENDRIVGMGGMELCAPYVLIRSLAVASPYRGKGIAKRLYLSLEQRAQQLGISSLYLLTETAADFFKALGFEARERDEIPMAVQQTRQFRELCPASATVMHRAIGRNKA